jgi:predicted anti-sigma-YlaC factor YlaD
MLKVDCREVSRWLSRLLDEELPPADRERLRKHLVICSNCRSVDEQMQFLRRAMKGLASGDEPRR